MSSPVVITSPSEDSSPSLEWITPTLQPLEDISIEGGSQNIAETNLGVLS